MNGQMKRCIADVRWPSAAYLAALRLLVATLPLPAILWFAWRTVGTRVKTSSLPCNGFNKADYP